MRKKYGKTADLITVVGRYIQCMTGSQRKYTHSKTGEKTLTDDYGILPMLNIDHGFESEHLC